MRRCAGLFQQPAASAEREYKEAAGMKGILARAAIVLLGTLAYIGLGMALANAG